MNEFLMGQHHALIVLGDRPDELGDIPIIACEYETFWVEDDQVVWKMYADRGPIVIRMKIDVLMESMLGDATIMARFFNVKE